MVLCQKILTDDQPHGVVSGTADFEASSAANASGDQGVEPFAQTDADVSTCGGGGPGMVDPAAAYCGELGYSYGIATADDGQHGICAFPDGSECDAWGFLEGKCGQDYSYCARQGYGQITKADGKDPFSREYSVCVDGQREVGPVTQLMRLVEKATTGTVFVEQTPAPAGEGQAVTLLSSFDWRNYNGQNWVTSVKDQGMCGSCWAFSAVGAVEADYNVGWNDPNLDLDLSEEYLVSDCDSNSESGTCCGGWNHWALAFIRDTGISDESCLPYVDGSGCSCSAGICDTNCTYRTGASCSDRVCSDRCSDWASRLRTIAAAEPVAASQSQIKQAIVDQGPVSVCLNMSGAFDGQNVFRCADDTFVDHCVVVVGYDDASGYWIAKNSWGTSFGESGYFKVGYGECAIENYVYYAVPQPQPCPPGQYRLSMQVWPPGAGTTSPSANIDQCYASGTTVPIQAYEASGWDFAHWSGDCSGTNPSTSVQMNSNKTCTAKFAQPPSISGTVTDAATGEPLSNICVYASGTSYGQSGQTDSSGYYRVDALRSGDYKVQFYDCQYPATYLSEYYNNKSDWNSADVVSVTLGLETGGIDAALRVCPDAGGDGVCDMEDDDDDNDGWKDDEEVPGGGGAGAGDTVGSNPLNINSTPEVCDGVDNDGNQGIDEGFPDTNTDGKADCHDNAFDADGDGIGNASDDNDDSWWEDGGSWHNDMFPDAHENYLGTDKDVACSTAGGPDNDPFDCYVDGEAGLFDLMKFHEAPQAYGTDLSMGDVGYKRRLDLFGPDGNIDLFDLMQYFAFGQYGKDCPYGL